MVRLLLCYAGFAVELPACMSSLPAMSLAEFWHRASSQSLQALCIQVFCPFTCACLPLASNDDKGMVVVADIFFGHCDAG